MKKNRTQKVLETCLWQVEDVLSLPLVDQKLLENSPVSKPVIGDNVHLISEWICAGRGYMCV